MEQLEVVYDDKEKCRRIICTELFVEGDFIRLVTAEKEILIPKDRIYRIEKTNSESSEFFTKKKGDAFAGD